MHPLIKYSKEIKKEIIRYAKENKSNYTPINDKTYDYKDNFVSDNINKYFLSNEKWSELYRLILKGYLKYNKDHLSVKDKEYLLQLSKLKASLIELMSKEKIKDFTKVGAKNNAEQYQELLYTIVKENAVPYVEIIFYIIQNRIFDSINRDNLSEDFCYETTEISLCSALGKSIFSTYFRHLEPFDILSNLDNKQTSEDDIQKFENVWLLLFGFFYNKFNTNHEHPYIFTSFEQERIIDVLRQSYKITINNDILFKLVCYNILNHGLNTLIKRRSSISYIYIENYLSDSHIDKKILFAMQKILYESRMEPDVLMGSIIVNYFIKMDLFSVYVRRSKNKTINMLKLNHTLIFNFMQNGSNFKPLLCETNRSDIENQTVFIDDIEICFKNDQLLNNVHGNPVGIGYVNPDSVFGKDISKMDLHLSIDEPFLEIYLKELSYYASRKYHDFITQEEKEGLFDFLSIYNIDFKQLLDDSTLVPYKELIYDIVNAALDFENVLDIDLELRIKYITIPRIQYQFKMYFSKIRSYKLVLIFGLADHIVYSCFNYFIMPSFFDIRGRRYYIGVSFNLQSYPFLKSFLKIRDIPIHKLDKKDFELIKQTIGDDTIIDDYVKNSIDNLMPNLEKYKTMLLEHAECFLYSHLDPTKISREEFHILFTNCLANFSILYHKLLSLAKNKGKALMLTSFMLLEKRKKKEIVPYANTYSYDMVTSGYQLCSILFQSREMAKISNIILFSEQPRDVYLSCVISRVNKTEEAFGLLTLFFEEVLESKMDYISPKINETKSTLNIFRNFLSEFTNKIFERQLNTNYISELKQDLKFFRYVGILLNDPIKQTGGWMLHKREKVFLRQRKRLLNKNAFAFEENLLILARIYDYYRLLEDNLWLVPLLKDRKCEKHIIMINIYGGTYRGRQKAFFNYLEEACMEKGIMVNQSNNKYRRVFGYIENHYKLFDEMHLKECHNLITLAEDITTFADIITIKSEYFTCLLAPARVGKPKRIRINTKTFDLKRKDYQLNLYQARLEHKDFRISINKRKQISLFRPYFIHFLDAYCVQLFQHILLRVNNSLKLHNSEFRFFLSSIHDNFTSGLFLFPIIPSILLSIYRHMFKKGLFTLLKENMSPEEFSQFLVKHKMPQEQQFTVDELNNSNFVKLG